MCSNPSPSLPPQTEQQRLQEEAHLKVMRLLSDEPELSQRELAERLGISVGKTNFLLKGLIEKGLIKVHNFRNSQNRLGYLYQLTPSGLEHKAQITLRYLKRRMAEYEALEKELQQLEGELGQSSEGKA
jgi:EPS-associated MarR family transcriptional regulator